MLDLGGIGPGYGVDAVGERLAALGSSSHLVELGGEARAWGTRPDGGRWRVAGRFRAEADSCAVADARAVARAVAAATSRRPNAGRAPD